MTTYTLSNHSKYNYCSTIQFFLGVWTIITLERKFLVECQFAFIFDSFFCGKFVKTV